MVYVNNMTYVNNMRYVNYVCKRVMYLVKIT